MPIKIHPHAIDLMSRYFNTHRKGYPEWMKNAREVYLGRGTPEDKRLVIINHLSPRAGKPAILECIDCGGISGDDIETYYMDWANPEAASRGGKVIGGEGGQGNGGKSYLRQMFQEGYFISMHDGKLSVVGFIDEKKYELGFIPDPARGKDTPADNPAYPIRKYAYSWLDAMGLPETHNVTIVRGVKPLKPIDIDDLVEEIQQYRQARQTIRTCKVLLYVDTEFKRQLAVREPELDPAFSNPIVVPIQPVIKLHSTDVATCRLPQFPPGVLRLKVSKVPLRGQVLQSWNTVDFFGDGPRAIGYKLVPELGLAYPAFANYVFGECVVPLLVDPAENYEAQGRGPLVSGPLSEALYQFIAGEVDKVLAVLAKRTAGVVASTKRKNLEVLNEKLARWIETKLSSLKGLEETGTGPGTGKPARKAPVSIPHDPPVAIRIHRGALKICAEVPYELRAIGQDAAGRIVPPGKLTWRSSNSSVVQIHPENGRLIGKAPGIATVIAENISGLKTPPLIIQVIAAQRIEIKAPAPPARIGSNRRLPLLVYVTTQTGTEKDAIVAWRSSNEDTVSVGQDGILVGGEVGEAEVVAFTEKVESDPLEVIVEKGAGGRPKGGGHGRPSILLSGQHADPFDGGAPVILQPTDPPVHQRPYKPDYENNVFWINLQHPLAEALLAHGEQSVQWRSYHFQRIVDVYTMLELRSRFADSQELDVDQVLLETHEIMSMIYSEAKNELFALLFDEKIDFATLAP